MALVERLKRWRGLARLRRRVRRSPSPATYGELAERYIALGEVEDALHAAEEGLEVFPDSERLAQVRTFAKKGRLTGQIRKLRDDLQRRPSPLAYTQLAEIYRELGSHDDALAIAAECAERFPLNENPYLLVGEIRLERFLRDQVAKDAVLAESALSKVVRLNGHNVKAHLLLAELYHLVGVPALSRRHLRSVLAIMPTARDVQDFLRETEDAPETGPEDPPFEELAQKVEETGCFAAAPERFPSLHAHGAPGSGKPRACVDADRLDEETAALGSHPGVRSAVVIDRDGEVLADLTGADGPGRRPLADLVVAIRATADDASRRMDTGALVRAEIEGPAGNVTVVRARSATVAVLYSDPMRRERVWELLQDFVARNLAASREEIHA